MRVSSRISLITIYNIGTSEEFLLGMGIQVFHVWCWRGCWVLPLQSILT
jgi:hypothetical protein